MKLFGWLFLALLVAFQLIGWFGFGRSAACTALWVIVIPSSLVSGAAFFGYFFWSRSWVWLPPVLLTFIQIDVSYSGRTTPGSALLSHAMAQFLDRKVGGVEAHFGSAVLLFGMIFLATVAAFCTAEIYRLYTGQGERGGMALIRGAGHALTHWDMWCLAHDTAGSTFRIPRHRFR